MFGISKSEKNRRYVVSVKDKIITGNKIKNKSKKNLAADDRNFRK